MNESSGSNDERQREQALHRYIGAVNRGDLDGLEAVLREALLDPELDRQIASVNEALHDEAGLQGVREDAQTVNSLLLRYFPAAALPPESTQGPTVGDVAARIQGEPVLRQQLLPVDKLANQRLLGSVVPLPLQVTAASIARFAQGLDVLASDRYWELFRREAVMAAMAREAAEVELLAARKQSGRTKPSRKPRREYKP